MQKLEQAVDAAWAQAGEEAEDALAEVKILAHQAEAAESDVITCVVGHRAEIAAVARKYGPQAVRELEAVAEKLLASVKGSFGIG